MTHCRVRWWWTCSLHLWAHHPTVVPPARCLGVDVGGKCNIIGVIAFAVRLANAHEQFGFPIGG